MTIHTIDDQVKFNRVPFKCKIMILGQLLYFLPKQNITGFRFDLLVMHQTPGHKEFVKLQKTRSSINTIRVQEMSFKLIKELKMLNSHNHQHCLYFLAEISADIT